VQNCADATAALIDNEVMELLKECYDKAYKMLSENREALDKIAEFLFEKETITGKEFMKIYREVKGLPEPSEEKKDCEAKEEKPSFDSIIGEAPSTASDITEVDETKNNEE
jgi:cell division protease FtsH